MSPTSIAMESHRTPLQCRSSCGENLRLVRGEEPRQLRGKSPVSAPQRHPSRPKADSAFRSWSTFREKRCAEIRESSMTCGTRWSERDVSFHGCHRLLRKMKNGRGPKAPPATISGKERLFVTTGFRRPLPPQPPQQLSPRSPGTRVATWRGHGAHLLAPSALRSREG